MESNLEIDKLKLPAGFKEIVTGIKKQLIEEEIGFHSLMEKYIAKKHELNLPGIPSLISDDTILSKEFLTEQTILFSQSQYFGKVAKDSPMEVKPLLYYYAENSLYEFFISSLFSYNSKSGGHGLVIDWNSNINNVAVQIKKNGMFSRIIDCYSMLKADSVFSSLTFNHKTKDFDKNNSEYSIQKEPTLTLEQVLSMRQKIDRFSKGYTFDPIEFLLLFIASSLARYKPYFWNEIVRGEKDTKLIWFNQCFKRFDKLWLRLVNSLIHGSTSGYSLFYQISMYDYEQDAHIKNM